MEQMNRRDFLALSGTVASGMAAGLWIKGGSALASVGESVADDRYGLVVLVDGWRADLFAEMLEGGELPNIKEHLVDRGTMVEHCVGAFPSTTGPAHLPFLTGTLPGRNDVPGVRWVDRKENNLRDYCTLEGLLINKDYSLGAATLYEFLAGHKTLSIFEIVSRGAFEAVRIAAKVVWWIRSDELWEKFDEAAVEVAEDRYLRTNDPPRFTFVWMPGMDHLAHFHGSVSETVREEARNIDGHIGRIAEVLKKCRIYDKTLFALVSDHGLRDNEQSRDPRDILEDLDFDVKPSVAKKDVWNDLRNYNAARAVSGNGFAHVYVAKRTGGHWPLGYNDWEHTPDYNDLRNFPLKGRGHIDLVEAFREEEAIRLVCVKEEPGRYLVFSGNGQATIERQSSTYKYTVEGEDPLGYSAHPHTKGLMDGAFHSANEWLRASCTAQYPDGVVQISQLFDSRRCGDIVLSSMPGWDLMKEGHIASHGGLEKEEMVVPVVLAGPGIAHKRMQYARTVDVFPTYLRFFGLPKIDGQTMDIFG